jgi:hypothetical protein
VDEKSPRLPWARMYLILLCGILPLVFVASFTQTFQHSYPFYQKASRSLLDFVVWEAEYLSTFIAVEYFFPRLSAVRTPSLPREPGVVCLDGSVLL